MAIDSAGYWQNHSIYNLGTSWYTMYCPYYSPFSEAPKFSSAVLVSCSFNLFFQLCPTLSTLQFYQVCSGGHKPNSENRVNLLGRLRSQVGSSKHRFSCTALQFQEYQTRFKHVLTMLNQHVQKK